MSKQGSSERAVGSQIRALELYAAGYDFPEWRGTPRMEYMLAATPRSGSSYLSMELWRTGVMGAPLEYVNPCFRDVIRERLGFRKAVVAYWRALKRVRTSPNGVFGFKMFIGNYIHYSDMDSNFLHLIVPDKVVYLTRENLFEQAVSYSKAMRSGAWFHGAPTHQKPTYDPGHINQCADMLRYQYDFWKEIFSLTGTTIHHVTYEALLHEPRCVVNGIANFLGVALDSNVQLSLPLMNIQRDAESAEWVKRLKKEHGIRMNTESVDVG